MSFSIPFPESYQAFGFTTLLHLADRAITDKETISTGSIDRSFPPVFINDITKVFGYFPFLNVIVGLARLAFFGFISFHICKYLSEKGWDEEQSGPIVQAALLQGLRAICEITFVSVLFPLVDAVQTSVEVAKIWNKHKEEYASFFTL